MVCEGKIKCEKKTDTDDNDRHKVITKAQIDLWAI
jgi:hypothetical protein